MKTPTPVSRLFVVTIFKTAAPDQFLLSMACPSPGPKLGVENAEHLRACLGVLGVDSEVIAEEAVGSGRTYRLEPLTPSEMSERALNLPPYSTGLSLATHVVSQQEAAERAERCIHEGIARITW